jgi:hypothetical protein
MHHAHVHTYIDNFGSSMASSEIFLNLILFTFAGLHELELACSCKCSVVTLYFHENKVTKLKLELGTIAVSALKFLTLTDII